MKLLFRINIAVLICGFLNFHVSAQVLSEEPLQNDKPIEIQLFRRNLEVIKQSTPSAAYLQDIVLKVSNDIISINNKTKLLKEDSLKDLTVYELKYLEAQEKNILKDVEKYKLEATGLRADMLAYKASLDTFYQEIEGIRVDSLISYFQASNIDSMLGREHAVFIEQFKSTKFKLELARSEVDQILENLSNETRLLNELGLLQVRNIGLIVKLSSSKLGIRSSTIWTIGRKDNFTKDTLANLNDSLGMITKYLLEHTWRFYIHALIYFIILGITLYLKRQKELWERYNQKEAEIEHVLRPLRNPNTSSFLLTLSLTSWVHYGAPGDFFDVILIMLPIPILVFIYRFKQLVLFREALFFAIVFILVHFQHFIVFNSLFHRLVLGILAVLMVYSIHRIQKKSPGEYLKTFKYLFILSEYVLYLSIFTNVIGYFELSQFLINQVSASIVLGALFHISSFVVRDIFKLFLLSDKLQQVKSISKNYDSIKLSAHRIIRALAVFSWLVVVLKNSGFYDEITEPILTFLYEERSIGSVTYSISGLVLFVVTIYLSTKLSRIIEEIFKEDYRDESNLQKRNLGTITIMVRYGVISVGLLIAIAFSGLPVENITIIIGALGVGIGFGLQNIFNNLVSGFILAVEKPIQIGDIVQVEAFTGEVQDIGIRASKVKTFDGAEVIIPNGDLIASNVINWTHSDRYRRIELFVGVAYGTDTEKVLDLLNEAIKKCALIRSYPEPIVVFHKFGDSSLDFRILCWTTIENFLLGRSELSVIIDKLFKEHQVTIPFPQRDLYIKSFNNQDKQNKPS